jgi:hypothetical protein
VRPIVLPGLILVAACQGGEPPADADEALACIAAGRGDTYTVGLQRTGTGGQLDFKLMSATPAPPGFNNNDWIIQINAMTNGVVGEPASGATIRVTPFMPDHVHGTPIRARAQPLAEPGQYKLSPINMWMPGYWEITIDAQVGAVTDSVMYKFCIQA